MHLDSVCEEFRTLEERERRFREVLLSGATFVAKRTKNLRVVSPGAPEGAEETLFQVIYCPPEGEELLRAVRDDE